MRAAPVKCIEMIACLLCLTFLFYSIQHCISNIVKLEHVSITPDEPNHLAVGIDMRYFINAGTRYQLTGQLYERTANYGPLAPLYKFPPAFQLQLLPFTTSQNPESYVTLLRKAQILGYFATCLAFGLEENLFFYGKILPQLLSEPIFVHLYNKSAAVGFYRITQDVGFANTIFQVYRLAFLCLTAVLLFRYYPKIEQHRLEVFSILLALTLICLPNYWLCYLVLLFPALCVTIRRLVIQPCRAVNLIGLACQISMITYMQDWLVFGQPQWLHNEQMLDQTARTILAYGEKGNMTMVWLMFALHYPWFTLTHFLDESIFFVPAFLWFFTASEIVSPALPTDPQ